MKDTYYSRNHVRGVLRIDAPELSWNCKPDEIFALKQSVPWLANGETLSNEDYLKQLHIKLRPETIDHSKFYPRFVPKAEDLNYHLVERIWQFIAPWLQITLRFFIDKPCLIVVLEEHEMRRKGAYGLFCSDICEIQINRKILSNEPYTLITLAHELAHYAIFRILPKKEYEDCPMILSEGLSEYMCRLFYRDANYDLPDGMRKSWDENYELGRKLVKHIVEDESFGIMGFVKGFLLNIEPNNPLKYLDYRFLM